MGALPELRRGMTLVHALALVVGVMVGTGIYLRSALMAQQLGSAPLVLLAWFAAGLLSIAGALTYAELATRLPHTGGEYVFLRQTSARCARSCLAGHARLPERPRRLPSRWHLAPFWGRWCRP